MSLNNTFTNCNLHYTYALLDPTYNYTKIYKIYGIKFILSNPMFYIGSTHRITSRLREHINSAIRGDYSNYEKNKLIVNILKKKKMPYLAELVGPCDRETSDDFEATLIRDIGVRRDHSGPLINVQKPKVDSYNLYEKINKGIITPKLKIHKIKFSDYMDSLTPILKHELNLILR